MAKNPELERVVIEELYTHLKDNPSLRLLGDDEEEFMRSLVQSMGQLMVNIPHKIRHHWQNHIGYGYDFSVETGNDITSKAMYETAVKTTRNLSGEPHFEIFVDSGIVDNRFGWYITRLP